MKGVEYLVSADLDYFYLHFNLLIYLSKEDVIYNVIECIPFLFVLKDIFTCQHSISFYFAF